MKSVLLINEIHLSLILSFLVLFLSQEAQRGRRIQIQTFNESQLLETATRSWRSNAVEREFDNGDELAVLKALLDCLKVKHEEEMEKEEIS